MKDIDEMRPLAMSMAMAQDMSMLNRPDMPDMSSEEEEDDTVSEISVDDEDLFGSMEEKMKEQPKLLRTSAGHRRSCCVFRVPRSFIDSNDLQKFQEHKWRYLKSFLSKRANVGLAKYLEDIQSLESKARDCYSETIDLTPNQFVKMMVLDGCFIVELFLRAGEPVRIDDPIFAMSWVRPSLSRDLLRLENQIPFFILQRLFDLSKIPGEDTSRSLAKLALEFFNTSSLRRPDEVLAKYENTKPEPEHLLDLLRSSFASSLKEPPKNSKASPPKNSQPENSTASPPKMNSHSVPSSSEEPPKNSKPSINMIHSVTKLRRAGITCKQAFEDSFLDIKFSHGEMKMPAITIDDFTCSFLQNCIAYEQCRKTCSKHVTTYAIFMDCLINTPEDVGLLCDGKVIQTYLGDYAEVAQMFNKLGKDVAFDIDSCYLSKVFHDIEEYFDNYCHVHWATFRHKYFDSPWSRISLLAAVLLLLCTFAQAFFAAYDSFKPK